MLVTGQGTAAVAGQSLAATLEALTPDLPVRVEAIVATELSGFELADDMADTLVVAISQSGTTTDTNRTVDLVRSRGAAVVAIVNRRGSDLTDKSDGVLYTSDGRDVEMSVASTKAFYAQVAAGVLLAAALAEELGATDTGERAAMLAALRGLPDALARVLEDRERIGAVARELAPGRRYWAVVGNGPNRIAAAEVRIKLSELCYKSIACDVTEDKKHIDLSSEPMILVCAAGLDRVERRRRREGGGDLPGPQGGADRHRHRGRRAVHVGAAGPDRARPPIPGWPSCCRPWSATSSATRPPWPSTRAPVRCVRPAPPSRPRSAPGSRASRPRPCWTTSGRSS